MRVAVYAICKNESAFAERWMKSMEEADEIYVLDTGSQDGSPELLRTLGARVSIEIIEPWRFDNARNASLKLVPEDVDICVCTDLDEVFHPGWRAAIEKRWRPGVHRGSYRYTWSFNKDGSEGCVFYIGKIHSRKGFRWVNPVHEVLQLCASEKEGLPIFIPEIQLDHLPDDRKSRAQYLPLLQLAVEENPEDDRNVHYLGREYFFKGQWENSIETLKQHLALRSSTWADERCASMRYIARSYAALGRGQEAEKWFWRAVAEAPHLREPWLDYAAFAYINEEWSLLTWLAERAVKIRERPRSYTSEAQAWGSLPYDYASLGLYYTGRYAEALKAVDMALSFEPENQRLLRNKKLIEEKLSVPCSST